MRYVGGKVMIASKLAPVVNRFRGDRQMIDPFCGGLAMAKALGGRVAIGDVCAPLIHMYRAVATGWVPPAVLTLDMWRAAKDLPDTNPLKAFAGFACSFRGNWFAGYAGGYVGPSSRPGALAQSEVIVRDVRILHDRGCEFAVVDFLALEPRPGYALYLDPPYRGTLGYGAVQAFDHDRFIDRVEQWARFAPVCVSEYDFPIGEIVWEHSRGRMMAQNGTRALERLYVIGA